MERSGCQGSEELENLASHGSPNALQADCTCEETVFFTRFPRFFLTMYHSLLLEAG